MWILKKTGVLLALAFLCLIHQISCGRAGGGGRGGGSASGGSRVSSSSSFGSSSSSSGSRASGSSSGSSLGSSSASRGAAPSPSAGSSSRTSWGGSAASGSSASRAGPSSFGSTGGNARPNYGAAGSSAARSSVNRPTVNAPTAVKGNTVPAFTNNKFGSIGSVGGSAFGARKGFGTGSLLLAGVGGAVGGYMLGSMIASSMHRSFYGPPPWYYDSYIPYRYRYGNPSTTITNNTTIINNIYNNGTAGGAAGGVLQANAQKAELCDLARWNMELPYTELPNMVLTFLSSDNISGSSVKDKSQFLYTFFNTTYAAYGNQDSANNVFTIPPGSDLRVCNFNIERPGQQQPVNSTSPTETTTASSTTGGVRQWYDGAVMNEWRQRVKSGDRSPCVIASFAKIPECEGPKNLTEEPFYTAVKNMVKLYSNTSSDDQMIRDVVAAAQRCYPIDGKLTPPKETQACLDFSISSDQALALNDPASMFGNAEICRTLLSPDLLKCSPAGSTFPCTLTDLVNLNVFARNYYLCEDPVDPAMIPKLQERFTGATPGAAASEGDRKSLGIPSSTNNGGPSPATGTATRQVYATYAVWSIFALFSAKALVL